MTRRLYHAFAPHNTRPDSFNAPSHHTMQDPTALARLPITQHKTRQLHYTFPQHNTRPDSFRYAFPAHNSRPDSFSIPPITQHKSRRLHHAFRPHKAKPDSFSTHLHHKTQDIILQVFQIDLT